MFVNSEFVINISLLLKQCYLPNGIWSSKMPGHVKRGGTGEPDPDPSPFLFVSWEDKQNDMAKVMLNLFYIHQW